MRGTLIVGGSGGIGLELVHKLRKLGEDVVFTYRKEFEGLNQIEEKIGAKPINYDFQNVDSQNKLVDLVLSNEFIGLVNLAALPVIRKSFLKINCEELVSRMDEELLGSLKLCQAFAQSCKKRNAKGSIVNVLTSYVLGIPPEKLLGYVMTKQAQLGMTRSLAIELAKMDIRVNSISPEMTRTKFISDLPERFIEIAEEGLPFKRIASPLEVANVIAFLLSDDSSYITGANIPITGGISC